MKTATKDPLSHETPLSISVKLKEKAEAILSFGAIAYAGGFLTIMFHTGRIGVPAVELLKPINILIGLPLAIIFSVINTLASAVKKHLGNLAQDLGHLKTDINQLKSLPDHEVFRTISINLIEAMPIPGFAKSHYEKHMIKRLDLALDQSRDLDTITLRFRRGLLWCMQLVKGYYLFMRSMNFAFIMMLIPFALFIYTWEVYPRVPQRWGGGKPTTIKLVISSDKWPEELETTAPSLANFQQDKNNATRATSDISLLFKTEDNWYVLGEKGNVISISADAVIAVVWRESGLPHIK